MRCTFIYSIFVIKRSLRKIRIFDRIPYHWLKLIIDGQQATELNATEHQSILKPRVL